MTWTPKFTLDLQSRPAPTRSTRCWKTSRRGGRRKKPRDLDLTNGWKIITPEIAEGHASAQSDRCQPQADAADREILRAPDARRRDGRRPASRSSSTRDGKLIDAGHRLLGVLSLGSFVPNLRHRRRACRSRPCSPTSTTARRVRHRMPWPPPVSTACPSRLGSVVSIAMHFEQGCYTASTKKPLDRVTPIEVVHYAQENENLRLGVRLMAGEYKAAAKILVYKDVAASSPIRSSSSTVKRRSTSS